MKRKWVWIVPAAIAGIAALIAIGGALVMALWNWLMPSLFALHMITFWQAVGLLALCRILFVRLGGGGFRRSRMRRRMQERMGERWEAMSPEERERFRHGLRGRCGFSPPAVTETKG